MMVLRTAGELPTLDPFQLLALDPLTLVHERIIRGRRVAATTPTDERLRELLRVLAETPDVDTERGAS